MRKYIDLDLLCLVEGPGITTPVTELSFKRGTAPLLEVQFGRHVSGVWTPELLAAGTVLRFGPKESGKYDGAFVVFSGDAAWTTPGSASGFYSANPSFNTTQLNALLFSPDGNDANDVESVTLMSEFSWRLGVALPTKTETFNVVVHNAVDNGSESAPSEAGPDHESRITQLELQIGPVQFLPSVSNYVGGEVSDLDAKATASLDVNYLVLFVVPGEGLRFYQLAAGTDSEDVPAIIRPDDYNTGTNEKVWKSVL